MRKLAHLNLSKSFVQRLRNLLVLLLISSIGTSLYAQTDQLKASLDTNQLLIGQQTYYRVTHYKLKTGVLSLPTYEDTLTSVIEILELKIDTVIQNDTYEITYSYLITSFDSGFHVIPPAKIIYKTINDTAYKALESNPLLLTVNSVPVDLSKDIKDIKNIIDEPLLFKEIFVRYILPLLILTLLIVLLFYIHSRRKINKPIFKRLPKPLPPADVEALDALNKLKEEKLWQNNQIKEYYFRLTDIIRHYIGRTFDIPAQEMVTNEILGYLKSIQFNEELLRETVEKLELADLVKFAKLQPIGQDNEEIMKWAVGFVEATRNPDELRKEENV